MEWWWLRGSADDCSSEIRVGSSSASFSAAEAASPPPPPSAPSSFPIPSAPLDEEPEDGVTPHEEHSCSVCLCTLENDQDAMRCVGEGGEFSFLY